MDCLTITALAIGIVADICILFLTFYACYKNFLSNRIKFIRPNVMFTKGKIHKQIGLTLSNATAHPVTLINLYILFKQSSEWYKVIVRETPFPMVLNQGTGVTISSYEFQSVEFVGDVSKIFENFVVVYDIDNNHFKIIGNKKNKYLIKEAKRINTAKKYKLLKLI